MALTDEEQAYPDLFPVFKLENITPDQMQALLDIGIYSLGDLQRYDPFHYARLLVAKAEGEITQSISIRRMVDFELEDRTPEELVTMRTEILEGIGPKRSKLFEWNFQIITVEDLANSSLFLDNMP